jgi:hypothetical protein
MNLNIVTSYNINQLIKLNSKYYKVDLGQSITLEDRSGERTSNTNDKFAFVYSHHYKTSILKQGKVGDITFYTDHLIIDDKFRFYIDREEFIYDFDLNMIQQKGIDAYLGNILKLSKESYEELINNEIDDARNKKGNADKVVMNPGSVRYEDLQAYIEKNKSERLKK